MRRPSIAFTVACAVAWLVMGCGGSSPTSTSGLLKTNGNNCGAAYGLRAKTMHVTTVCGGVVGYPPVRVKLRVGERFEVTSADVERLGPLTVEGYAVERTSAYGASVDYKVRRAGTAMLIFHGPYCEKSVHRECTAFVIVARQR